MAAIESLLDFNIGGPTEIVIDQSDYYFKGQVAILTGRIPCRLFSVRTGYLWKLVYAGIILRDLCSSNWTRYKNNRFCLSPFPGYKRFGNIQLGIFTTKDGCEVICLFSSTKVAKQVELSYTLVVPPFLSRSSPVGLVNSKDK